MGSFVIALVCFAAGYTTHALLFPCAPLHRFLERHKVKYMIGGPIARTHYLLRTIMILLGVGGVIEIFKRLLER